MERGFPLNLGKFFNFCGASMANGAIFLIHNLCFSPEAQFVMTYSLQIKSLKHLCRICSPDFFLVWRLSHKYRLSHSSTFSKHYGCPLKLLYYLKHILLYPGIWNHYWGLHFELCRAVKWKMYSAASHHTHSNYQADYGLKPINMKTLAFSDWRRHVTRFPCQPVNHEKLGKKSQGIWFT